MKDITKLIKTQPAAHLDGMERFAGTDSFNGHDGTAIH
jgi:hypothetical protein